MRCPVCRAENDQGPNCRRCKADLSMLFALEERHHRLLAQAKAEAVRHRWTEALMLASEADDLRRDPEAQRLLALGYLLHRDFESAWRYYQLAKTGISV
ncbi:MAG: hypothetical protein ACK4RK_03585 [Gemmataceae bacterium]